ncbi:hypothetical protein [Pandoraea sp. CB10b_02]|nr:hypothetical protein [Pandoraea sp. CB10b_02]
MAQLTDAMVALGEACAARHRAGSKAVASAATPGDGRRKRKAPQTLS